MIDIMLYQLLIVSLCSGASGSYGDACNKTVEATSITIGINKYESELKDYTNKRGKYLLGNDLWNSTGFIGGLIYQGVKDKSLSYKIKTKNTFLGTDFIKPQADYRSDGRGGSLSFGWSW